MADLSAVLRKTIDGLPRQTPALREKVYEKARAAIVRQIETADPPLGEDVVAARRGALEDAIARTESHYTGLESPSAEDTAPEAASAAPAPVPAAPPRATPPAAPPQATRPAPPPPAADRPAPAAPPAAAAPAAAPRAQPAAELPRPAPPRPSPPRATPTLPPGGAPLQPASSPLPPRADAPLRPAPPPAAAAPSQTHARPAPVAAPQPAGQAPSASTAAPPASPRPGPTPPMPPTVSPAAAPRAPAARLAPGTAAAPAMPPPVGPVSKLPPASVPDARPAPPVRREPVFEPVELDDERPAEAYGAQEHGFVPEDGGEDDEATGYVDPYEAVGLPAADVEAPRYAPARRVGRRSRVPLLAASALVLLLGGGAAVGWIYRDDLQALLNGTGSASPSPAPVADTAPATPAATTPATSTDTQVASAPPAAQPSAPADGAHTGTAAPASAAAAPEPRRRFTQRLLADGSEVDAGPAKPVTNDFDEGTEVAEASPVPEDQPAAAAAPDAGTVTPDTAATGAPAEAPAAPAAGNAQQQTAALQPQQGPASIAVGQRAVFYEERSNSEPATQQTGNVVWTLVNEAPAEGQPPEPAIHAVADVPDENLKMTMTIRRNSDVTLPASHVIELSFEVPPNFQGGEIANVQRLALKPTEQARGEPLIGVAGKISDGFFIIALNNLQQATDTNLDLLMKQEWIDIPVAYSNGRRALLSIEKGLPGDRVFEQAISAWKAKT